MLIVRRREKHRLGYWLHVLALVTVVLIFGGSFALLSTVIGITSPWLVLLLMFYFLGIANVGQPVFKLRMPRAFRPLCRCELEGHVYRRLRVLEFGRLLRQTPLRYLNSAVYLERDRRSFLQVLIQAESGEASHFWAGVLLLPYIGFAGLNGMWSIVVWFSLAQVLVNVYPILHLRYTRGRLDRVLFRTRNACDGIASGEGGAS